MDSNTTTVAPEPTTMDPQTFGVSGLALQTAALAALIFAVCACIPKLRARMQLAKLPVLDKIAGEKISRQTYLTSPRALYNEGYQKFKDRVYVIAEAGGECNVVVPPTLLPELRKLGDDYLSFPKAIDNIMETRYTHADNNINFLARVIKASLTPALPRINAKIGAEVETTMREHLPSCSEWTEVAINSKLLDIIAKVSGRAFVGEDLYQDPEYLDCAKNYTLLLFAAVFEIKPIRSWLKPFLVPRLPAIQQLRNVEKRAVRGLEPLVRERMEAEKNDPDWQKPDDMIQWLINHSAEQGGLSVEYLAEQQLGLIFAAIHTTTASATNIMYALAATPEYHDPLREEITDAMSENDGKITTRAMQQMVKLDSYIKEVFRLYPVGIVSFERRVLKGINLSNGQYIPPGVLLSVPALATYADSARYPDSSTFDGFRHYKLRQGGTSSDHARNQFVTTNESNLGWGYGSHACPGRFFAANEIKMIFVRLLLDFDIKMPGDRTEVWPQLEMGGRLMTDPSKTIMLRTRKV